MGRITRTYVYDAALASSTELHFRDNVTSSTTLIWDCAIAAQPYHQGSRIQSKFGFSFVVRLLEYVFCRGSMRLGFERNFQ